MHPTCIICMPAHPIITVTDWCMLLSGGLASINALPFVCRVVETDPRIKQIREKVESFAASFPMPGFAVGKEGKHDISNGKVGPCTPEHLACSTMCHLRS